MEYVIRGMDNVLIHSNDDTGYVELQIGEFENTTQKTTTRMSVYVSYRMTIMLNDDEIVIQA